jgi:hypothetical protein
MHRNRGRYLKHSVAGLLYATPCHTSSAYAPPLPPPDGVNRSLRPAVGRHISAAVAARAGAALASAVAAAPPPPEPFTVLASSLPAPAAEGPRPARFAAVKIGQTVDARAAVEALSAQPGVAGVFPNEVAYATQASGGERASIARGPRRRAPAALFPAPMRLHAPRSPPQPHLTRPHPTPPHPTLPPLPPILQDCVKPSELAAYPVDSATDLVWPKCLIEDQTVLVYYGEPAPPLEDFQGLPP